MLVMNTECRISEYQGIIGVRKTDVMESNNSMIQRHDLGSPFYVIRESQRMPITVTFIFILHLL